MSNVQASSYAYLNVQTKDKANTDKLEDAIKDLYERDKIKTLSIPEISNLAREYGVTTSEVMDCIESQKDDFEGANKNNILNRKELNGESGFYYGASSIPASSDSMDNLNNYSDWMRNQIFARK